MPSNVEIKARISDVELLKEKTKTESGSEPIVLCQEDIFFHVPNGRLKLRKTKGSISKLIAYERADTVEAKQSDYDIAEITDPESLIVMMQDGQTQAEGTAIAKDLMKKLCIQDSDLVDKAYVDFLLDKQNS